MAGRGALAATREKYPSSAYLKPLVPRGIGFALIELDLLDKAQLAFEASLGVKPNSELAKTYGSSFGSVDILTNFFRITA